MKKARHTYPSKYPPGAHWAVDEAWKILDRLPPKRLTLIERAYLAGLIAGTLDRIKDKYENSDSKVL
jgi:hypothetical protein